MFTKVKRYVTEKKNKKKLVKLVPITNIHGITKDKNSKAQQN